jgi:mono/diheme cytochrome c family protein
VELFAQTPDGARRLVARVDLDALPTRTWTGHDPQYAATLLMRGSPLESLWSGLAVPSDADLALLRFDNGLLIPIPFRDAGFMRTLAPQIVRANVAVGPWAALARGHIEDTDRPPTSEDLRRVSFHGNKVMVADARRSMLLPSLQKDLAPWLYADSLHSVDFVRRTTWEAQFSHGPAVEAGMRIYLGSCVICHAVRGTGGALGWDFIDPYPIYSDEWMKHVAAEPPAPEDAMPARTLLDIHVRYRDGVNGSRSMPALRGMTADEVTALWSWLQATTGARTR